MLIEISKIYIEKSDVIMKFQPEVFTESGLFYGDNLYTCKSDQGI